MQIISNLEHALSRESNCLLNFKIHLLNIKMIRLTKCCCCCDLKTGAVIIAILTFIGVAYNGFITIKSFMSQAEIDAIVKDMRARDIDPTSFENEILVIRIIGAIGTIVGIIVGVCLCIALTKNRSGFVIPWLVCQMISIVFNIIVGIMALIAQNWIFGAAYLLESPLSVYFWICMYSFYLELKECGSNHRPMY